MARGACQAGSSWAEPSILPQSLCLFKGRFGDSGEPFWPQERMYPLMVKKLLSFGACFPAPHQVHLGDAKHKALEYDKFSV